MRSVFDHLVAYLARPSRISLRLWHQTEHRILFRREVIHLQRMQRLQDRFLLGLLGYLLQGRISLRLWQHAEHRILFRREVIHLQGIQRLQDRFLLGLLGYLQVFRNYDFATIENNCMALVGTNSH